jgi:hypothetical protein
MLDVESR